jgi:hypothetical protein
MLQASRADAVIAEGAVDWISANQHEFSLAGRTGGELLPLAKPVTELAIAGDVIASAGGASADLRRRGEEWVHHAWQELRNGDVLFGLVQNRPDLVGIASPYPIFRARGLVNRELEAELKWAASLKAVRALELPPWRKIEVGLALARVGAVSPWDINEQYRATWLAHAPEPWAVGDGLAYSVSHTVFYMTGFGAQPHAISKPHRRYIARWVPVWASYYYATGNYDICGEMLMTLRCVGHQVEEDWMLRLSRVQLEDGAIPGPSEVSRSIDAKATGPRKSFLDNYHTTLVTLMACSMCAQPQAASLVTGTPSSGKIRRCCVDRLNPPP